MCVSEAQNEAKKKKKKATCTSSFDTAGSNIRHYVLQAALSDVILKVEMIHRS
jgi:hypothetical protein